MLVKRVAWCLNGFEQKERICACLNGLDDWKETDSILHLKDFFFFFVRVKLLNLIKTQEPRGSILNLFKHTNEPFSAKPHFEKGIS